MTVTKLNETMTQLSKLDKKLLFWAAFLRWTLGLCSWYSVAQYAELVEMAFSVFYWGGYWC